jgi:hypothetical protein
VEDAFEVHVLADEVIGAGEFGERAGLGEGDAGELGDAAFGR